MTQVTRTRLDRCSTKDCPWPSDEKIHQPWCRAIKDYEHSREAQHQHWPKRSQGGKTIVAILCHRCHDRVDNTALWENRVDVEHGRKVYRLADRGSGEILIERDIGGSDGKTRADDKGTRLARDDSDDVAGGDAVGRDSDGDATDGNVDSLAGVAPSDGGNSGDSAEPLASGVTSTDDQLPPSPGVGQSSAPDPIPGGGAALAAKSGAPPPFTFHDNGIEFEPEITFEQAVEAATQIGAHSRGRQWKAGDAVNALERFGERGSQYLDEFDYPFETLSNYANVASAYPLEERRSLPFSYSQSVYKHPDRLKLLDRCLAEGLSRKELRGLAGYAPPPKPKKWSLAELHEAQVEWDGGGSEAHQAIMDFLEHLEKG